MRVILLLVLAGFLAITGLICLITGIVLLTRDTPCDQITPKISEKCSYSEEAVRGSLDTFLQKVQDSHYRLHPNRIAYKPRVLPSEIRGKYCSYDPSTSNIKLITDEAWALLDEINKTRFQVHKPKPRERKALAQVKHYLQHVFGTPYDVNYYAGDFLMGPNLWCWQPLCETPSEIKKSLCHFKPNSTRDLENLLSKLVEIKETFAQYKKNMEYGVLVGMVRSVEECNAGINGLTSSFRNISIKGAMGKVQMFSQSARHPDTSAEFYIFTSCFK